jgi:hypothetical protein
VVVLKSRILEGAGLVRGFFFIDGGGQLPFFEVFFTNLDYEPVALQGVSKN